MTETAAWPALGSEDREWTPSERVLASLDVFERHRITRPYRAAVVPPIAHAIPHLAPALIAQVTAATDDVARFDEQMASLPVPMPAVLLRSESASSSQIEHLSTSARQLAFASLGVSDRENAQVVAANVEAMRTALETEGPLDAGLVLQIHETLLGSSQPDIVGCFRDQQVWIGGRGASPHGADFVPPHHEHVPAAIDDLSAFAAREDMPPLVHAALVHAQFETIHPFEDGNGRTGRVISQLVLRQRGLVRNATVPISSGLLQDTSAYFAALTSYRKGDVAPIVEQMARAAQSATASGRILAHDLRELREQWTDNIRSRSDSTAWRLAELLFAQPVVNAAWVAEHLGVSARTARTTLDVLEQAGILTETTAARRNRVWQATSILTRLDEFAADLGRRPAP
jgi:Fic family protein